MRPDLLIHIVAGSVGIVSGFVALFVVKGAMQHRRSGMVFVYSMLVMALMGSAMALTRNIAPAANGPVGFLTAYLVLTGLTTVRPPAARARAIELVLLTVAMSVCLVLSGFAVVAMRSPKGRLYGMPAAPFIIFASIALLASIGDLRLIRRGGTQVLRGTRRIARHLWRMSFALLIAAFSFFLGQAKVIPKPIRILPLLLIPPLLVLATMLYWMWRMRFRPHSKRGPKVEWSRDVRGGIMLPHSLGARDGSRPSAVRAVRAATRVGVDEHRRGTG